MEYFSVTYYYTEAEKDGAGRGRRQLLIHGGLLLLFLWFFPELILGFVTVSLSRALSLKICCFHLPLCHSRVEGGSYNPILLWFLDVINDIIHSPSLLPVPLFAFAFDECDNFSNSPKCTNLFLRYFFVLFGLIFRVAVSFPNTPLNYLHLGLTIKRYPSIMYCRNPAIWHKNERAAIFCTTPVFRNTISLLWNHSWLAHWWSSATTLMSLKISIKACSL